MLPRGEKRPKGMTKGLLGDACGGAWRHLPTAGVCDQCLSLLLLHLSMQVYTTSIELSFVHIFPSVWPRCRHSRAIWGGGVWVEKRGLLNNSLPLPSPSSPSLGVKSPSTAKCICLNNGFFRTRVVSNQRNYSGYWRLYSSKKSRVENVAGNTLGCSNPHFMGGLPSVFSRAAAAYLAKG